MARLTFEAPNRSRSHLAFRQRASTAGFQDDHVRNLLWLVNAHPNLTAHGRIFKNLAAMLSSDVFDRSSLAWAGAWQSEVPHWVEICCWAWNDRSRLERIGGLDSFFRLPANNRDHPLMDLGIVRHAIPAALWNRHNSTHEYPPDAMNLAASRYFKLQCHVFAAYAECRFRLSSLDFYENYEGRQELPVAPIRTGGTSPAVREFSRPAFSGLIAQFDDSASTPDYASRFEDSTFSYHPLDEEERGRARQYVDSLNRFFHRFRRVLKGWTPPQAIRRGWGGGARAKRPGYIDCGEGVYFKVEEPSEQFLDRIGNERITLRKIAMVAAGPKRVAPASAS